MVLSLLKAFIHDPLTFSQQYAIINPSLAFISWVFAEFPIFIVTE